MRELFIDVETYSSVDIGASGAYKYIMSPDFEILMIGYAIDDGPVKVVDLVSGEEMPEELEEALFDEDTIKHAHNAVFERRAFMRIGYDIPINQWRCSAVKAAYCGLPLKLAEVSKVLDLKDKKLETGTLLIKYFSCPCKPTKINGGRTRNYPKHAPEKWAMYKEYNKYDVLSEREIVRLLQDVELPDMELRLYELDQQINDRGILVDLDMAKSAISIDEWYSSILEKQVKDMTGLANPNSAAQLKGWLSKKLGRPITTLLKAEMPALIESCKDPDAKFVLEARQRLAKSSVKKYMAMLNCAGPDHRARGLFQFYGANRTGRWAGRLIQLQNLPQNHIKDLDVARTIVKSGNGEDVELMYDNVPDTLSQLIRTAFIAPEGKTYAVADFSAIEARVISWFADEEWRLEVFRTHGKIYEATASRMFNVPISMVTKGSDLRQKGKISELALGYGGSLGAMKRMGGERMGLSDGEMMASVRKWRAANAGIVAFWNEVEACAIKAVRFQTQVECIYHGLVFTYEHNALTIKLPSGRKLFYRNPIIRISKSSKVGAYTLYYEGVVQETKQWGEIDTYGGKLTENIVQATARDLLGHVMLKLASEGYPLVMHVHDEVIAEVPEAEGEKYLKRMCEIMAEEVPWAKGLPLRGDGYITKYYKKD